MTVQYTKFANYIYITTVPRSVNCIEFDARRRICATEKTSSQNSVSQLTSNSGTSTVVGVFWRTGSRRRWTNRISLP